MKGVLQGDVSPEDKVRNMLAIGLWGGYFWSKLSSFYCTVFLNILKGNSFRGFKNQKAYRYTRDVFFPSLSGSLSSYCHPNVSCVSFQNFLHIYNQYKHRVLFPLLHKKYIIPRLASWFVNDFLTRDFFFFFK